MTIDKKSSNDTITHEQLSGFPDLSAITAVIFDMDGVILDTENLVQRCWIIVADKYGIPDIIDTCKSSLGRNTTGVKDVFLQRYGQEFPYDQYKQEVRDLFFQEVIPVKKGAEELLQMLKTHHYKVALASSTRSDVVRKELSDAGLIHYFDKLVCGDMVSHSKPHPEIFQRACEELGVLPHQAFAIEDSFSGIRSAHAGGLHPIMVPDTIQPTDEIRALTDYVCKSLQDVENLMFSD